MKRILAFTYSSVYTFWRIVISINGVVFNSVVLSSLFLLVACDQTLKTATQETTQSISYPREIKTALGTAIIKSPARRIVTLGAGAEDIVLSFGIVPVGIESHRWGGDQQGFLPWFRQTLEQQGHTLPVVLNMYPELDIEQLIGLRPDLIIATQSGITQSLYDQLSLFAPVIAYPHQPWLTSVQQQIALIAQAIGKEKQAESLVNQLHTSLTTIGKKIPQINQFTFAYIKASNHDTNLSVYVSGDPRVETLVGAGLKLAPSVNKLVVSRGSFSTNIGLENADILNDVDILVTWYHNQQEQKAVEEKPLFNAIPAVQRGGYIPMTDPSLVMAMSYGTPLSIRWGLERFIPILANHIQHLSSLSSKSVNP